MIEAVKYGLANYVNFNGRTGRATFWWWVLAVILAAIVASILDEGLGAGDIEPFSLLLGLALFLPHLAMAVRRLHDTHPPDRPAGADLLLCPAEQSRGREV